MRAVVDDYTGSPDDVTCSACGAANPAQRSFCRRCGVPLAERAAGPQLPWWRRWRRNRNRRRGPGGRLRRLLGWLALFLALAALVWAATAYGPGVVSTLRDRFTKPTSVRPESVRASGAASGHPAESAVDGTWNTFWAPASGEDATGQWFEASFQKPFRLTDLVFHSGSSDRADAYLRQARPGSLTVTAWDDDGRKTAERTLVLKDEPGEQAHRLTMTDVSRLRLTVRSVHGQGPSRLVALGEVEFFRRS
ncbi:discoidin domain-containing protein [Streptomyces sp. TRM 70351]|uniref:NADase-type glycan-binding domain-containing protein n=1 Tax=Streptomyces sp. TRM 70351 TaxID=3116552 RepID=UPI002E7AC584|nr:discoidin domain-containing protein [Streptomyces sp. TRM 70351]MEE1927540.1 discoidin domain-containing protein [Streptomyces sp. TRM 70351]